MKKDRQLSSGVILNTTLSTLDKTDDEKKYTGIKYFFKFASWLFILNYRVIGNFFIIFVLLRVYTPIDTILYTYLSTRLIDAIILGHTESLSSSIYLFIAFLIFSNSLNQIKNRIESFIKNKAQYKYSLYFTDLFKGLGLNLLENVDYANKVFRVRNSNDKIWDSVGKLVEIITYSIALITTSLIIINMNIYIGIIATIIMIIRAVIHNYELLQDWKFTKSHTENTRIASSYIQELRDIESLRNIIIDNSYNFFKKIYQKFYDFYYDELIKMRTRKALYGIVFEIILIIIFVFFLYDIINKFGQGTISIGMIAFSISAYFQYTNSFKNWSGFLVAFNEGKERLEDAYEIEQKVIEINKENENTNRINIDKIDSIEIKNLSFKYPQSKEFALKDINISIKRGDNIAIVGENGAGKSTLFNLLLGVFKVDRGMIFINGIDINDIDIQSLYSSTGVLSQLYNKYDFMSLRDNVKLDKDVSDDNIQSIIDSVKLSEEVKKYKEYGLNQILGHNFTNGVNLSGGQWQKLAIARVIAKNPDLVFFDEPTSSIDTSSESIIINNLFDIFKEKTMLLISHRFSTLKKADYIYVLDKGKLIEKGNHKELMELKGKYCESYTKQLNMYKDE